MPIASIVVDIPSPSSTVASLESAIATILTAFPAASSQTTSSSSAAPPALSQPPTTIAAMKTSNDDGSKPGECQLLGSFALLVQGALGALALLALVYKRWRERPQRPIKIWCFDVSKQVFGSVLVHIANIFMSMLTSGRMDLKSVSSASSGSRIEVTAFVEPYVPNPCSFYLLNLAIDTTVGIAILILLLRVLTALVRLTPLGKPKESLKSGHYGHPPKVWWWLKQSVIYFLGLLGMKFCVLVIFMVFPFISKAGDWALGWTEGNEKLQIAFVMMIFPLIMNALQYYIIDSFIKNKEAPDDADGEQDRARAVSEESGEEHDRLISHQEGTDHSEEERHSSGDESTDLEASSKKKTKITTTVAAKSGKKDLKHTAAEYDPEVDGEAATETGNASDVSLKHEPPTELYPKE